MLKELIFWHKVYAQDVLLSPEVTTSCSEYGQSFYQKHQNSDDVVESCYCYSNATYTIEWWPYLEDQNEFTTQQVVKCETISSDILNSQCKNNTNGKTKWDKAIQECSCPNWYVQSWWIDTNECLINGTDNLGIQCDAQQLINGTCSWNINKTLGIRSSETTPNPTVLLQDVVLAATSFVWTMIMVALIVMGVKYVQWWFDEWANGDLKSNIKKLIIWLFLVIGSYTIIRLVQYVARGY